MLIFYGLGFLFFFIVLGGGTFLFTRKSVIRWRLEGPQRISEHLRFRNQKIYLSILAFLVVVGFIETMLPSFSLWMQDLQITDLLGGTAPPKWAVPFIGNNGTFSWLLYFSIFGGCFTGLIAGTMLACRSFADLQTIGVRDVIS